MHTRSHVGFTGALIMATLVTACGGDGADDTQLHAAPESPRLFSDPSTSGPRLDVYEADGNIAVFVGGPIGTEQDVLARVQADSSLVELYRALHPSEPEVPSELEALDEWVGPVLRDLAESASTDAPAAFGVESVDGVERVEKSESTFRSTVCKTFTEGSSRYTPVRCTWKANINLVTASGNTLSVLAGDRVYGWNNASLPAQIKFFTCLEGCDPAGVVDLPAFWWSWGSMLSGGPYVADLHANPFRANPGGERGATHHALSFIIR